MALVNKALLHPKQFNIEMLKMQFEEEDRETLAKQEEWKEAKQKMIAEKKCVFRNGTLSSNFSPIILILL